MYRLKKKNVIKQQLTIIFRLSFIKGNLMFNTQHHTDINYICCFVFFFFNLMHSCKQCVLSKAQKYVENRSTSDFLMNQKNKQILQEKNISTEKKKDLGVSLRCQTPLNETLLLEKIKAVFKSLAKNVLFSTNQHQWSKLLEQKKNREREDKRSKYHH